MEFYSVTASLFTTAALKAKESQGPKGLCMTIPEGDEVRFFLSEDFSAGYALDGNTLCGVFAHATEGKGALPYIMSSAAAEAFYDCQHFLNLDCFAPLAAVYGRYDFKEVGRVAFDWQYAPEGWTADMGEPPVIFMQAHVDDVMAAADVMLDRLAA